MRYYADQEPNPQLDKLLNQGLELGDNFNGALLEITTTGAEQEIIHNLGFTPSGWIVIAKTGQVDIWTDNLELWNNTSLFLSSSVANLTVRLFVL